MKKRLKNLFANMQIAFRILLENRRIYLPVLEIKHENSVIKIFRSLKKKEIYLLSAVLKIQSAPRHL